MTSASVGAVESMAAGPSMSDGLAASTASSAEDPVATIMGGTIGAAKS